MTVGSVEGHSKFRCAKPLALRSRRSSFARYNLIAVAAQNVGHRDAPECLVGRWETLALRLVFVLVCPSERVGFQTERAGEGRSAVAPHLYLPPPTALAQRRHSE
jgi:hypothetical protein